MRAPFNHYDLDVGIYSRHLAAYALGRQLRRVQWHLEQFFMLAVEAQMDHPHIDRLTSNPRNRQGFPQDNEESAILGDLKKITDGLVNESDQQKTLAEKSYGQFDCIVRQLPTIAIDSLLSSFEDHKSQFFALADESKLGASELLAEIRQLHNEPESSAIRSDGLRRLLKPLEKRVNLLRALVRKKLDEKSGAYFSLGDCVESMICPRHVAEQMALDHPLAICTGPLSMLVDYYEGVAASHCFYLAYHSFAPGALKLSSSAVTNCRKALEVLQLWDQSADDLFARKRTGTKPTTVTDVGCDIEVASASTGDVRDSNRSRVSADFTCRIESSPSHEQLLDKINRYVVERTLGHRVSISVVAKPSMIEGVYGESFTFNSKSGKLKRNGTEIAIKGKQNVAIIRELVAGKGSLCPRDTLIESSSDNLHAAVSRLNKRLDTVNLKAKNERDQGYRLVNVEADEKENQA